MVQYAKFEIESTYGTDPNTSPKGYEILNESLKLNPGHKFIRSSADQRIQNAKVEVGQITQGKVTSLIRPDMQLGFWLKCLFGKNPVTTTLEVGRYQHVFTHADDPAIAWPSMAMRIGVNNLTERRYPGLLVDSADFYVSDGAELGADWNLIGRPYTAAAIGTAGTYGSQKFYTMPNLTTFQLAAVTYAIRMLSISIKNNMNKAAFENGNRGLARGEFGELEVVGEIGLRYTTQAVLDDFLAETPRKLTATFVGPTLLAGTYQLKFEIDQCSLEADNVHFDEQKQIIQSVPFTAYKNGSNPLVQATLIDAIASYA